MLSDTIIIQGLRINIFVYTSFKHLSIYYLLFYNSPMMDSKKEASAPALVHISEYVVTNNYYKKETCSIYRLYDNM